MIAIPKVDWQQIEEPKYLPVKWTHENGSHCLDLENAKNLAINEERKTAYIEKLQAQIAAMKSTYDTLSAMTGETAADP